jgi:hypothetical protein
LKFLALGDQDHLVATAIVRKARDLQEERLVEVIKGVIPVLSDSIGIAVNNALVKALGG